jgi:hypothetical protein
MSVVELYRELKKRGIHINNKSLYRLSNPLLPVERIDTRIAGHICEILGIDLSSLFIFRERVDLSELLSFPAEKQTKLERLLEKNREGKLSNQEEEELASLVEEAEHLMLTNARLLSEQRRTLGKGSVSQRKEMVFSNQR